VNLWDEILNEMSDVEWAWWPVGYLRPAKHAVMTTRLVAMLSILYGVPLGMLGNVLLAAAESELAKLPFIFPIGLSIFLFVFHRLTFTRAWNRRATRLSVLANMEREQAEDQRVS
jgi:hypothetical protein